jgi:predicted amidohydrolase
MMRIATTQYQLDEQAGLKGFCQKMENLVEQAKADGADLILLPEYAGIEISHFHEEDAALFQSLQPLLLRYIEFFQDLAKRQHIYIQPGTIPVDAGNGQYVNRAYFFGPGGSYGYQDKLQLITSEKESRLIAQGKSQTVFDTAFGKIGIAICYDSEFPEIVRRLTHAGAWLILVPSYTVTNAGYNRVYYASRARAMENQCYLATSCMTGPVKMSKPFETTVGHAAILSPMDIGFPDDGILALGKMNEITMISATLNRNALEAARTNGHVQNYIDREKWVDYSITAAHL